MAQLSSTILSGSILLPTTENTSSAGNIWFDGTNVKYSTTTVSGWSTGGNLNNGRVYGAATGTSTAAIAMSGINPGYTQTTENYNGTAWTTATNPPGNQWFRHAAAGTQDAAVFFSGYGYPTCNIEWNGSSWTSVGSISLHGYDLGGTGTQNAALAVGGAPAYNSTSEYNGSTWSAGGGDLPTARRYTMGTVGTQNAAVTFGGGNCLSCTNEYNGSSWSTGGSLITGTYANAGIGSQDNAISTGGYPSPSHMNTTEEYNGSSWSVGSTLSNSAYARLGATNGSLSQGGLVAGGAPITTITQEYNSGGDTVVCTL